MPSVVEVYPRREVLHRLIEQPGYIEGFERTDLFARIPGYVREYRVDIGDTVRKGQLLAELWVPELVADLHRKEATVTQSEAQILLAREALRAAEAAVVRADANVRFAEASRSRADASQERWQLEYNRDRRLLYQDRSTSPEQFETTTNNFRAAKAAVGETTAGLEAAKATLTESKATRDKSTADVKVAEARLQVAKAARDYAAAILGYARIEAPYDGIVSRRGIDTGTYVQAPPAGNKNGGTALFQVVRTDKVRIFVDVPEADAPFVLDKGPARVQVQALEDREFTGAVTRSS